MTTLHITSDTPEAMRFLEYARTLPFVREKRERRPRHAEEDLPFERIPGLPYTQEERIASVRKSEEEIAAGRVISHEDLMKEVRTWGR